MTEDVNSELTFKLYERTPYEFTKANSDVYALLKEHARTMRNNPTDAEAFLWRQIKGKALGVAFKRQCVILDYIADFFCPENNLVIEVDGGYHELPEQMILDEARTRRLEESGYNILRFTNEEVLYDIDSVIQQIVNYIRL